MQIYETVDQFIIRRQRLTLCQKKAKDTPNYTPPTHTNRHTTRTYAHTQAHTHIYIYTDFF